MKAKPTPSDRRLLVNALSAVMILIGALTIAFFFLTVLNDPGIQLALTWTPGDDDAQAPSLLLIFLERFGIIVSTLFIGAGGFFIAIGWRLRHGHIRTAYWARILLLWLAIGVGAYIALTVFNILNSAAMDKEAVDWGALVGWIAPALLILLGAAALWYWLNRNIDSLFGGEDSLIGRETRLAWNLLIPTLTIFVLVAARPLEQTFIRSLTDKRFAGSAVPQFVGLENYSNLLSLRIDTVSCRKSDPADPCSTRANGSIRWESIDRELLRAGYRTVANISVGNDQSVAISGLDDDFIEAIGTTVVFTIISVALELVIGLFMAMVVNSKFRGRGAMRAVMLVPWAIPTVISARLWELMLKDTTAGIFNKILLDLQLINAPQAWLSDPSLQIPTAIIVDVWKTAPFMALLLLAGLQVIPSDLYEAASVDGASPVRRFFSITLPLLRPAIAIALIFRTLDALRVFDLFNVLFGRQQLSMATYNFETLVSNQMDGYASAISVIIFIFISIFAFIYVRLLNVES
ncbi:MAG: sugar ABC transporter permease [Chloroflexi bacterium]|nr:sugar ABC transporter permease [Chloroflexota bacterium]